MSFQWIGESLVYRKDAKRRDRWRGKASGSAQCMRGKNVTNRQDVTAEFSFLWLSRYFFLLRFLCIYRVGTNSLNFAECYLFPEWSISCACTCSCRNVRRRASGVSWQVAPLVTTVVIKEEYCSEQETSLQHFRNRIKLCRGTRISMSAILGLMWNACQCRITCLITGCKT